MSGGPDDRSAVIVYVWVSSVSMVSMVRWCEEEEAGPCAVSMVSRPVERDGGRVTYYTYYTCYSKYSK